MERIKVIYVSLAIVSVSYIALAEAAGMASTTEFTTTNGPSTTISRPSSIMYQIADATKPGQESHERFECGSEGNRHIGNFTLYDYSIVVGMLVISLGIGVFYGFFNSSENTSSDFLHGSEMSLLPVSLSLTTSFITAIELLGNPSEITFYGTQFSLIGKYLHYTAS